MAGEKAIAVTADNRKEALVQARFEALWGQQRPRIQRLVLRLTGDIELSEDLTQEVSVRAFQGFGNFRGDSQASTWFYRIAVNVVNRHQERKFQETLSLEAMEAISVPADEATEPEANALKADILPVVRDALQKLPEDLRTTLILQFYEGLKYREIAAILDIPIGTVKSRLHSAIQKLREELHDYAL